MKHEMGVEVSLPPQLEDKSKQEERHFTRETRHLNWSDKTHSSNV